MDDHIGLVFFGQTLGLANGGTLLTMFAGDPLVALTTNAPTLFIRNDMLMPCTAFFAATGTIQKDFDEFD